jgi:hypothetical protein
MLLSFRGDVRTMAHIFISYARLDRAFAERLYRDLQRLGLHPWLDVKNLLPGQNWRTMVTKEIRQARFFLALLSNHSISKRGFVQEELKLALEVLNQIPVDDIFIIPVRLEECLAREARLQELHWVDLFPVYEQGFQEILRAVLGEYRGKIVLHVEDEEVYELLLKKSFEPFVRYKRVSLLSEAAPFVADSQVRHFILDLRLPTESPRAFADWGDYPKSVTGLIRKIRRERPDASVTILTNYPGDPEMEGLIKEGLLSQRDVISKQAVEGKSFADSIIARIDGDDGRLDVTQP